MENYNHQAIDKKWQRKWLDSNNFKTGDHVNGKKNEYILVEFPYPSGNLHVGHWYTFAGTDIYARYRRMKGANVLYPIGFDSFGLPAENAAIKRQIDPSEWTYNNIDYMVGQLERMGAIFDWDRKVATSDPEYYKWTQWIFTKLFENKLAYKKKSLINWDPIDKTILANEQVMADGTAERSGAKIEKKEMDQWFIKITDYADRLYEDLDTLDWPEEIKAQQKNWIGKSHGSEIEFKIKDSKDKVKVFTTRPETLFGVTYIVVAPESQLLNNLKTRIINYEEVHAYINEAKNKKEIDRTKNEREKTGIILEGIFAINPANNSEIPIFVADYVLENYGTGAVMAVPAHDQRDYEFAKKFNLPITEVITGGNIKEQAFLESGKLVNSGLFDGLECEDAKSKITEFVNGKVTTSFRLRDWSVGRQRYWGTPVPIVYDPDGVAHAVPMEHLPWILPTDVDHNPTGEPPLAKSKELKERTERIFGPGWTPEVETLDTFVDSSWYFLRYLDSKNNNEIVSKDKVSEWMPVAFYCGGAEHTNLHLLYSRFFNKFLFDQGISPVNEPYKIRLNHSLILGPDGNKMSKSKGNVVDPDEIVERLGADTVRLYLAFMGPYNESNSYPWDPNGVVGMRRFLEKIWRISEKVLEKNSESDQNIKSELHKTIKSVDKEFSQLKFNTGIAKLMSLSNLMEKGSISKSDFSSFIKILSVVAPHISEEIWEKMGNDNFVSNQNWPEYEEGLVKDSEVTIAIQINGKIRGKLVIDNDQSEDDITKSALSLAEIDKWINGQEIKKVIYVKGRILNIVI